jgi:UDP-glucose 4-epimerase
MAQQAVKRIIMTGLGGRLGRLVARRLHRMGKYHVVGIDRRVISDMPKDIEHLQVDLRSRRARDVFRAGPVDAFIHLGLMHDLRQSRDELHTWNVVGTSKLLEYCSEFHVRKVIFLSSAIIYGPRADNAQFLTEEAPLLASVDFPAVRDLVEADMQATSFFWKTNGKDTETVVLRPVHILGGVNNAASNYLRLPRVPILMGFDPMLQVIHEEDVAHAIVLALKPGVHGVMNLTGPGEVPLSVMIKELEKPTIPVPSSIFSSVVRALWRFRLSSFVMPEISHIRYVCMIDGSRARQAMGFKPQYSLKETIHAVNRLEDVEREALRANR